MWFLVDEHSTLHSPTHSARVQQTPAMSHFVTFCHTLSHHVTHLTTQTPADSMGLYFTVCYNTSNKEASNDNMLVIDANCMPEGATELILMG